MDKDSKFNERESRIIAAQLIVAKGLVKEPLKTIKFITQNRKYFPSINDSSLQMLILECGFSQKDIDDCPSVVTIAEY